VTSDGQRVAKLGIPKRTAYRAFLQNRILAQPKSRRQLIASEFFMDDEATARARKTHAKCGRTVKWFAPGVDRK
jgi:hypothetical protein